MKTNNNLVVMLTIALTGITMLAPLVAAANTAPMVSNIQVVQRESSFLVDITYDVADAEGDSMWVTMYFSPDGGGSWPVRCSTVSGAVGAGIISGTGHAVVWDARADYPGLVSSTCSIRVTANDRAPYPYLGQYWRVDSGDTTLMNPAEPDTFGFGELINVGWTGVAPAVAGLSPYFIALLDTVYPFDDGILGYKYYVPDGNCVPVIEDCWQPRYYDAATGDSVSYWGANNALVFANDGSGASPMGMLLPSGPFEFDVNALDINGLEIPADQQRLGFTVNFDPETVLLNGETDWAHPEDAEVYPYYIQLNDPAQVHHPFAAGDRIPDRTYVVFKALGRDDPRDAVLDNTFELGFTGSMDGVRSNTFGGSFWFSTDASELNTSPAWGVGAGGWYADTLGFLTGPVTEFTMNMQAVDEHGRRDGTPASLSFDVGYAPCVQCLEIMPKSSQPSAWNPDLECADDPTGHPCFVDAPEFRVTMDGLGNDELEYIQRVFMLVNKATYAVEVVDDPTGHEETNYVINARKYRMSVLMHGQDDPRESWAEPVRRMGAWRYQVDYDCDPFNQIKDGGGSDDIADPTWGERSDGYGLQIDPSSGLWRLGVDVIVPQDLFLGPDTLLLILTFLHGDGDPVIGQAIFDAVTKQFGNGMIQAVAMDQTMCGIPPARPATFHYFRGVRPSSEVLPSGTTWRDCNLFVPGIKGDLSLGNGAMSSRNGDPVTKGFRIVVETSTGDFACESP